MREKKIDLDRLSTQYCSEPYEYNAKKVVHMIPDIVAEMRALREIAEAAMRFHMGHVHFCAMMKGMSCDCNIDPLFYATRDYEKRFIQTTGVPNGKEESGQVQGQSQA